MRLALALLGWCLAITAAAGSTPDFDQLDNQVRDALQAAGIGGQPGERIELDRFAADGWEIRISAAWDGQSWRLLALRLHHPDRVDLPDRSWLERYQDLLVGLNIDHLDRLHTPQLFEVPPPAFRPVLPEETRARQFVFEGFWYRASWRNVGGPDEFARWRLNSFELVADSASLTRRTD
ncbi:MAG: hypothetical protein ACXIUM_13665 [Wenzhouxiangella sp.]